MDTHSEAPEPEETLYDVAAQVTDEVMGEGTYAEINAGSRDPGVLAAIRRRERVLQVSRDVAGRDADALGRLASE